MPFAGYPPNQQCFLRLVRGALAAVQPRMFLPRMLCPALVHVLFGRRWSFFKSHRNSSEGFTSDLRIVGTFEGNLVLSGSNLDGLRSVRQSGRRRASVLSLSAGWG